MTELAAVMGLELRQIVGGRKIFLLAMLYAVPLALTLLIRFAAPALPDDEAAVLLLFVLYPQVTCLLGPLLYGTTMVQTELEQKTWIYLATRPVGRVRIVAGKYLSVVLCVASLAILSLVVSYFLFLGHAPRYLGPLVLTSLLAVSGFTAVFALIGTIAFRRGMAIGLLYALIFEIVLSFFPALINRFTVTHYLRTLMVATTDLTLDPELTARFVGDAGLVTSLAVLAVIPAVALAGACFVVSRRQLVAAADA